MKNFIVFIVVISLLSVGGFVVYRVYYKGETLNEALHDIRSGEEKTDPLADAKEAYQDGDYAQALKGFEKTLQAYETNEPGGDLEEQQHRDLLVMVAFCYQKMWEKSGKTDETLRIKALRMYEKFQAEYPGDMDRNIGRGFSEVKNPPPPPAEAPATEAPATEAPATKAPSEAPINKSPAK